MMSKSTFKIIVDEVPSRSQVLLNDVPIAGVRRVSFDLDAQSMPFMRLEVYGEAIVEGEFVEQQMATITVDGAAKRQGVPVYDPREQMTYDEEKQAFAHEGVTFKRV